MKKRYFICFLLCLLIPLSVSAKGLVTNTFSFLTDDRIITNIEQANATDDSALNCAENIFIPYQIVHVVRMAVLIIKIVVPIILIIMGMLDFGRVVLGKPDEQMKKSGKAFASRLVAAVLIFLVISIVEMILPIINPKEGVINCFACIVKDADNCQYVDITYPDPTPRPSQSPRPTVKPTSTPSPAPSSSPSAEPTLEPSASPETVLDPSLP